MSTQRPRNISGGRSQLTEPSECIFNSMHAPSPNQNHCFRWVVCIIPKILLFPVHRALTVGLFSASSRSLWRYFTAFPDGKPSSLKQLKSSCFVCAGNLPALLWEWSTSGSLNFISKLSHLSSHSPFCCFPEVTYLIFYQTDASFKFFSPGCIHHQKFSMVWKLDEISCRI